MMFVVGAATALMAPARARACSPLPAYLVSQRAVTPADGAIRVPLNAEVTVAYNVSLGMMTVPIDHPELRLGTGEPALRLTNADAAAVFVLSPPVVLLPNTLTANCQNHVGSDCGPGYATCSSGTCVIAGFGCCFGCSPDGGP